jgi:hypothetical protein
MKQQIHRLDDETGVEFDGGVTLLYDTRAYTPRLLAVITYDEMVILKSLFEDGLCPICLKEIPQYDIICSECLETL